MSIAQGLEDQSSFPSDEAARTLLYLVMDFLRKRRGSIFNLPRDGIHHGGIKAVVHSIELRAEKVGAGEGNSAHCVIRYVALRLVAAFLTHFIEVA